MAEATPYAVGLSLVIKSVHPKSSLEIGFGEEGYSSHVFLTDSNTNLISVDKKDWKGNAKLRAEEHPKRFKFIEGDSRNVIPTIKEKFDFIYIDGNHGHEGAYTDIKNCMPLVKVGGVMLIDDCGVKFGAVDIDLDHKIIDGEYGVGQATNELLSENENWKSYFEGLELANGALAFKRIK